MRDDGAAQLVGQVERLVRAAPVAARQRRDEAHQAVAEVVRGLDRQLAGEVVDRHHQHAASAEALGLGSRHRVVAEDRLPRVGRAHRRFDAAVDVARDVADHPQLRLLLGLPERRELLPGHQSGLRRLPEGAVDEHREVAQEGREAARVALGVGAELGGVEAAVGAPAEPVVALEDRAIEDVTRAVAVLAELEQDLRVDVDDRQPLEDLHGSLRDVAGAGEAADDRSAAGRQAAPADLLADARDVRERLLEARVLVRQTQALEGALDPLGREALSEGPERVEHPGVAGVTAEEDEPAPLAVDDPFVVDQRRPELEQAREHRHVVRLSLDDVREIDVDAAGAQLLDRDLLDPEDDVARLQAPLERRAGVFVVAVEEGSAVRRLDVHRKPLLLDQLADVVGSERCPALPAVLVLGADAYGRGHRDENSGFDREAATLGRRSPAGVADATRGGR